MLASALILSCTFLSATAASGQPGVAADANGIELGDSQLGLGGQYRLGGTGVGNMRVDPQGRRYGETRLIEHRLRFTPHLNIDEGIRIDSEFQLAAGFASWKDPNERFQSAGDEGNETYGTPRGRDGAAFGESQRWRDQLAIRKLYLTLRTPVGQLQVGRQSSSWGMGMLANSGDDESMDWGGPRMGRDRNYGDVVDRILFATAPLAFFSNTADARQLALAIGGDLIVRDERTRRDRGDRGRQGVGAIRWSDDSDNSLGLYIAYRDLEDFRGDTLNVWAYDVSGGGNWEPISGLDVEATGELAWVVGKTTLGRNNAFPNEELDVQQLGYAGRIGAMWTPLGIGADLEVGYASGDSNTNDDKIRGFTFDPDYNPSLILFEHLRAAETVASAANVSDPERVGVAPDSVDLLPTNGAVTNALYLRPTIRYHFEEMLEARVAVLWAQAEEDVVDPYESNANAGGTSVNFQGGPGGERDLGVEVNIGLDAKIAVDRWANISAGVQGGRLWPGKAFANATGKAPKPIHAMYARLVVEWLPE